MTTRRLITEHRPFVLLLLFTIALDALSTIAFMSVLGPDAEMNPLVRVLAHHLGIIAGPMLGKSFQLLAACVLSIFTPRLSKYILSTVILVNLFAFVVNMHAFVLGG